MDNKITKDHIAQAQKPDGDLGNQTLNRMNVSHEELTNWALDFLPADFAYKNALDIGCGGGATIARLNTRFPSTNLFGTDYSATSVELSREFNASIKCDIRQGDVKALPYDDGQFDLITAFETVYFWGDLDVAFAEVNRCLATNGHFLVCCEMSDAKNPRWEKVLDEMHIMSIDEWNNILERNGFKVTDSHSASDEWICLVCHKI